ncbi:Aldolase-type TIM barrel [Ascosphaera apis ARSEF 7405]|uniref:Aldolase-type TIM barrel n=1 Tax=Ascosphaera apis ARSEF 7405 TaxID=392613 RepID=A0A167V8S5_9EURO|nr:Aldolase-type TIM barrel [Ascosphaera apis ARSEF 7405]
MCDPNNPNIKNRTTPQWALYQRECLWNTNKGEYPLFNTDPAEVERLAREKLSGGGWDYSACNAGLSWTHMANRQAFYRHRIIPRMLVDTNYRDTVSEIFGHRINAPIGFAPVGVNRIYHPTGELSPARVANELGLPFALSSGGSYSIEDVAEANGDGLRFFQLYQAHDDELAISMLTRAAKSGYNACIFTVDTWSLGWRHNDVAAGNYTFYKEHGASDIGLQDPVFQKRLKEAGIDPVKDYKLAGAKWGDAIWHGRAFTWEKAKWSMEQWKRVSGNKPFVLKGIQSVEDAEKAVEMGFDGIVVSNHAGRQVDGAVASLDALEKIVDAVGDKTTIIFDSGIRSGADVFKALALGAKMVFVGRLWIWGLGIAGEHGVRHVMKSLLADFDILMELAGYCTVKDITRKALDSLPATANLMPTTSEI